MTANRFLMAALAAILFIALPAFAQGPANPPPPTNVFGTILDPTGVPYNTGFIRFDLVPSGGPVPCVGTPCTSINGHYGNVYLDGNGHFQMNLYPNSLITPAGTQWQITVSEPGDPAPWCFGPQSFTTAITVTNTATMDVSATLSALAPQLCRNGAAGGTISVQHNGVLVGTQPILNLIDSASVILTVTNDIAGTRIDATPTGIAGTGCTLPGVNTGVLSEHPAGTCYDSAHFTWDDAASRQNLQAGLSNSIGATASLALLLGSSNSAASGSFLAQLLGSGNTADATCSGCFAFGEGNSYVNIAGSSGVAIGIGNTMHDLFGNAYAFGDTISLRGNGTANTGPNEVFGIGSAITVSSGSNSGATGFSVLIGDTINVTSSGATGAVGGVNSIGNTETYSAGPGTISFIEQLGSKNSYTVSNSAGFIGDLDLVGQNNTFTETTATLDVMAVHGDHNTGTGTMQQTGIFGHFNAINGCSHCYEFGENISFTSSNSNQIGIGLNAVPGLTVANGGTAHDYVQLSPLAFASLPTCAAGTEGALMPVNNSTTNVWGATITGGGANHVLAYCDGTNWTVAAK